MTSFEIKTRNVLFAFIGGLPMLACSGGPGGEVEVTDAVQQPQISDPVAFCLDENIDRTPIIGTSNNDVLTGTPGDDCIVGLGGQDIINAGGGNDIIFGGDGNDTIDAGGGNDFVEGGSGQDVISGGSGFNTLLGEDGDDQLTGGSGVDTLLGGSGQDVLTGNAGDDSLDGGDGDDRLFGGTGTDRLEGGQGQDRLEGGAGNDRLEGGAGDDTLLGGDGDDTLSDCVNNNRLDGGAGSDVCQGQAPTTFTSCAVVTACAGQGSVLDQSFTTPTDLGAAINDGFRFVGQTYTAGFDGTLRGVTVDVLSSSSFPLRVTIRGVTGGVPNGPVLGQRTLASGASSLGNLVTFTNAIEQLFDNRYAIVVDYPTAPQPPSFQGTWLGATGDAYPNGGLMFSTNGSAWVSAEELGQDVHFQTFVTPN